ncbi:MAG TPA: hypothetical protein VKY85_18885 [Candidatus Angelobacter sp.]|nr:hypothetical protein [Candidatus Angelobacter sp.]
MGERHSDLETETKNPPALRDEGSLFLGLLVCWLLNMVHLGIAYVLFVAVERMLPAVFVLVGAVGLLQIGYIAPIWYMVRRRGRRRMATGLFIASGITLLLNASFWMVLWMNGS